MISRLSIYMLFVSVVFASVSCRHDDIVFIPEEVQVAAPFYSEITGFYLLNEGNMGMNKSTLDYYDYTTGMYTRNIYGAANPDVPKELGDVGNDIAIYGSKLYAVINASNKVEVMNVADATRISQIEIANCRSIKFHEGYAYVTSYAGPIIIDQNYKQKGYVAKIDTTTLQIVDKCIVGFQPDGLEIVNGKIYVANSGGYMVPNYENTLSVIDLATFRELRRVPVAINLRETIADSHGNLWITSRGDYGETSSRIYCYDVRKERVTGEYDIPVSNLTLCGDSLYIIGSQWSNITQTTQISYAIFDVVLKKKVSDNFITDGTEKLFQRPYGIKVNPITREILLTDAKTYVTPGFLYCFDKNGILKWSVRTGDIPAHIVFTGKQTYNRE